MNEIHACVLAKPNDWRVYTCKACGFIGSLLEAIKHAVTNQFTVRS